MTTAAELIWEQPRAGTYLAKADAGRYTLEASAVQSDPHGRKHAVVLRLLSSQGSALAVRRCEVPNADAAKAELCCMLDKHMVRVAAKRERDQLRRLGNE